MSESISKTRKIDLAHNKKTLPLFVTNDPVSDSLLPIRDALATLYKSGTNGFGLCGIFAILGGSYKLPHSNLLERYNADLAYNNFSDLKTEFDQTIKLRKEKQDPSIGQTPLGKFDEEYGGSFVRRFGTIDSSNKFIQVLEFCEKSPNKSLLVAVPLRATEFGPDHTHWFAVKKTSHSEELILIGDAGPYGVNDFIAVANKDILINNVIQVLNTQKNEVLIKALEVEAKKRGEIFRGEKHAYNMAILEYK